MPLINNVRAKQRVVKPMDEIIKRTLLFDFYSELLTDKQRKIYEYYYLEDLSLSEIAENMEISRQGVHDAVRRCEKQLLKYEEKLKMVSRYLSNKQRANEIIELTNEIMKTIDSEDSAMVDRLEAILQKTSDIIDDM